MENYKIGKCLGVGHMGSAYVAQDLRDKKNYVIKLQPVINTRPTREIKKEIEFGTWIAKQAASNKLCCTKNLMLMHDYGFAKDSWYKHPMPTNMENIGPHQQKYLRKAMKSKIIFYIVYDLKDGTLYELREKKLLSTEQICSALAQLYQTLLFLHENGYRHGDIYAKNIAYEKTNLKHIKVGNLKIPTYGYIWSFIDYGSINKDAGDDICSMLFLPLHNLFKATFWAEENNSLDEHKHFLFIKKHEEILRPYIGTKLDFNNVEWYDTLCYMILPEESLRDLGLSDVQIKKFAPVLDFPLHICIGLFVRRKSINEMCKYLINLLK